jgi:hypothetical protein
VKTNENICWMFVETNQFNRLFRSSGAPLLILITCQNLSIRYARTIFFASITKTVEIVTVDSDINIQHDFVIIQMY